MHRSKADAMGRPTAVVAGPEKGAVDEVGDARQEYSEGCFVIARPPRKKNAYTECGLVVPVNLLLPAIIHRWRVAFRGLVIRLIRYLRT